MNENRKQNAINILKHITITFALTISITVFAYMIRVVIGKFTLYNLNKESGQLVPLIFNKKELLAFSIISFILSLWIITAVSSERFYKNISKYYATSFIFSVSIAKVLYVILFIIFVPMKRNAPILGLLIAELLFFVMITFALLNKLLDKTKFKDMITTKIMIEISMMAAICVILSVLADALVPKLPAVMGGGRISITVLPILLISFRRGTIPGLITGFIYSIFNMIIDGYIVHVGSIFLDYLLPFTLIGLAGLFKKLVWKNKNSSYAYMFLAVIAVTIIRYTLHSLSGVIFFKEWAPEGVNPYLYSFVYVNLLTSFAPSILSYGLLCALKLPFINEIERVV